MASFVMALSQLLHDMDAEYASGCCASREHTQCSRSRARNAQAFLREAEARRRIHELSSERLSAKERQNRSVSRPNLRVKTTAKVKRPHIKNEPLALTELESELTTRNTDDQVHQMSCEDLRSTSASLAHWLTPPISFTSDGSAFIIHDTKRLEAILPRYFGTNVYRSFHRQLNMYSFHSLTPFEKHHANLPTSAKVFRHQYFHRDADEETLSKIRRKQSRTSEGNELVKWEPNALQDMSSISSNSSNVTPMPLMELPGYSGELYTEFDGGYNEVQTPLLPYECPVWGVGPPAGAWPLWGPIFDNTEYPMVLPPPGSCRLVDVAPPPPEMIAYYLSLTGQLNLNERETSYYSPKMWDEHNPDIIQLYPTQEVQTVM